MLPLIGEILIYNIEYKENTFTNLGHPNPQLGLLGEVFFFFGSTVTFR